ncbi:hypothetical protein ADILRU_2307 [Leifsonia rubra CMS 76R]|nr:hypothetical protein ADILRU_2307 [Leifsonia rubra CMS 76R]
MRIVVDMEHEWAELENRSGLARNFIRESHRHLPMLRLYLPFTDKRGAVVRWTHYVPVDELPASLDWFEAADRIARDRPGVRGLDSCTGQLDENTAAALRDAIGNVALECLRWVGYAEVPRSNSVTRVFGEDYFGANLDPEDVSASQRVPEFAWNSDGRLAWGGRLYPDSLIIAAEVPIFRQLRNDPRLDTASVIPHRDILPPSSGD